MFSTEFARCIHCGRDDSDCLVMGAKGLVRACRNVIDYTGKRLRTEDGRVFTVFNMDPKTHRAAVADEVRRTLDVLRRADLFEVRILKIPSQYSKPFQSSGYFTDTERAAKAVARQEERFPVGVYRLLNPPHQDLHGLAADRMEDYPKTTTADQHVQRLLWLLVDVDSIRIGDVCATREQLAAAMTLTAFCQGLLAAEGFTAPVKGCSGNGGALLYPIDMENTPENVQLLQRVLHALDWRVRKMADPALTAQAHVDLTTFNPARISRVFGTMNRKGVPTPRQPHRRARLLAAPQKVEPTSIDVLRNFVERAEREQAAAGSSNVADGATSTPPPRPAASPAGGGRPASPPPGDGDFTHRLKVGEYLTAHGYGFTTKPKGDWTYYVMDRCPFDPSHGPNGEVDVHQNAAGAVGFCCKHNSCVGRDWDAFKVKVGEPDDGHYDPPRRPKAEHASTDSKAATNGQASQPTKPVVQFIDSATFDSMNYVLQWLIYGISVAEQPAVWGGVKKCLKTSIGIDYAVSLGSGAPFLGKFAVEKRRRVGFISGESGPHTIQDTARNICAAKGITLAQAGVYWEFALPQLSLQVHLDALAESIREHQLEVVFLDPLYLCLLSGNSTANPANLFDMGPLLNGVSRCCLKAGATPHLLHHAIKRPADPFAVPELEDLAFAGVQEFARQWVLVGRREKYAAGSGKHQLWMTCGGSAGFSGAWGLDVDEGQVDNLFAGKKWEVGIMSEAQALAATAGARQASKGKGDEEAVLATLDRITALQAGRPGKHITYSALRAASGMGDGRLKRAINHLTAAGAVEEYEGADTSGKGAGRPATCYRRIGGIGGTPPIVPPKLTFDDV